MKQHLNLMSNCALTCSNVQVRLRQWTLALAVVVAAITPMLLVAWWPVYQETQQVRLLEAKYEPTRQLRKDIRLLQEQIERIRTREKITLSLAHVDTPIVTILGLIGRSIRESGDRIAVEQLEFFQDLQQLTHAADQDSASVDISGRGLGKMPVSQLAASLQSAMPFAAVKLQTHREEKIGDQPTQPFSIECSL